MATGMFGPSIYDARAAVNKEYDDAFYGSKSLVDDVGVLAKQGFNTMAEAFGGGDPRIVKANKMESIKQRVSSQIDMVKDPVAYYKAFGAALKDEGMVEEAANVLMAAEKMEDQRLDREVKKEELADKRAARAAALELKARSIPGYKEFTEMLKAISSGDTESEAAALAHYVKTNGVDVQGALGLIKNKDKAGKVIGTTPDGRVVYSGEGGKEQYILTNEGKVPYYEHVKPIGGVSIDQRGEVAGQQVLGEMAKEGYKKHSTRFQAAEQIMPLIARYKGLLADKKLDTGTLSGFRTAMKNLAVTMGVSTPEQNESVSDSQLFDSVVMKMVLPQMAALGGSDSNEELRQIREMTGDRRFQASTLKRIIEIAERDAARAISGEKAWNTHINSGGDPLKFNWNLYAPYEITKKAPEKTQTTAKYEITPSRIQKYKAYVKSLRGIDISDEQAEEQLKKLQPK